MELPTSRRDRIVMGLSICALVLFLANIASFIKHRFFQNRSYMEHAFVVSGSEGTAHFHIEGQGDRHVWRFRDAGQGNQVWSVQRDEIDCELEQLRAELEAMERELSADRIEEILRSRLDQRRIHIDTAELAERARFEAQRLHQQQIEVIESEDGTGRRRYRVVVKAPDAG